MPVFENLKNFIRQGKQAHGVNGLPVSSENENQLHLSVSPSSIINSPSTAAPPVVTIENINTRSTGTPHESESQPTSNTTQRIDAYNEAIQHIVEEEKRQKSTLPSYPGLERYKLIEKMGDGAFSIVYKALDTKSGNYVAVKAVHKEDLSVSQQHRRHLGEVAQREQENVQRSTILKEVAIMRQLRHKNITELLEFKETPEFYFIVLELVPGGELFHQIVRLTYLSEDLSRHVIVQVAEAVRYLHEEAGVVHRDIKPENLLFYPAPFIPSKTVQVRSGEDEDKEDEGEFIPGVGGGGIGVIKLADFGLSKIIWDSKTMTPCGTVGYTAPEIVKDQRYSKSVDMWALGCVLYTILCGFPPFYDESIQILTEKVAKGEYTFLSPWWDDISDSAKDLVTHLLTVDPERRYTIEEFMQHPWITQGKKPETREFDSSLMKPAQTRNAPVLDNLEFPKPPDAPYIADSALKASAGHTPGPGVRPEKAYLSPAIAMKEAFDVFNAVHRMEEENTRHRKGKKMLDQLGEEEDDEDVSIDSKLSNLKISDGGKASRSQKASAPKKGKDTAPLQLNIGGCGDKFFELNLDSSTLLERRKKRTG